MKKKYTSPEIKTPEMDYRTELLSGSNPYWEGQWEGPEPKEGCKDPYWCGN